MRAMGASILAACFAFASCVSVLDLSDYAGAAQVLCDHLQQCFGASNYDCQEHVSTGLSAATPEQREAWLSAIVDDECVAQCSAGKACLDATPVCNPPGETCVEEEQCCGFLDKAQLCQTGACCREDGQLCDGAGECCTDCDLVTGTCGGVAPCKPRGTPCVDADECCSDNCRDDGSCGFRCRELGEDCAEGSDCCSGLCQGSRCLCKEEGNPCTEHDECCLGQCYLGQCNIDPGCLAPNQECLGDPLACCQMDGGDLVTCDPLENRCCLPDGATLGGNAGDGLTDFCCSNASDGATCCGDVGRRCNGDSCCGGLSCRVGPANGESLCCRPTVCADPCVEQPAPVAAAVAGDSCNVNNPINPSCLSEVCKIFPACCCDQWFDYCAGLLKNASATALSDCMGICSDPIQQP